MEFSILFIAFMWFSSKAFKVDVSADVFELEVPFGDLRMLERQNG